MRHAAPTASQRETGAGGGAAEAEEMKPFVHQLALAVALLVALLLVGELGLFLAGVPTQRALQDPKRARLQECKFRYGDARRHCRGAEVEQPFARATVVTLGGSSAAGYPHGRPTAFPARLGAKLRQSLPGEYVVLDLAIACKDSIFIRDCVAEFAEDRPEIVVIYTGDNDLGNWEFPNPSRMIFLEEHAWLYEIDGFLQRTRLYSALKRMLLPEPGSAVAISKRHAERSRRIVHAKFEANMEQVIANAAEAGAAVILVTVGSNLYDHPIPRDEWAAASADLPAYRRAMEEGRSCPMAPCREWGDRFWAGVDAYRAERYEEALREFKRARDLYPNGRGVTELNESIRRLAERHPGVHLVDFERELDRRGVREGIGCNFFGSAIYCDQVHPNPSAHDLIAQMVLEKILEIRGRAGAG